MPSLKNILFTLAALTLSACASSGTDKAIGSNGYNAAGYAAIEKHGRLYLFVPGSQAEKKFNATGELSQSVTRIGKGPNNMTIVAEPDVNVDRYLAALSVGTHKK